MGKQKSEYLPHNRVKLVKGGAEYFDLLIRIIQEAQETIHLQTYIFDEDDTGTSVANALIDAAHRGVKIFMLVDGYGSQHLSSAFLKKLKDAGIFFRKFKTAFKSKKFYFGRRLHHKIVVVDSWRCTVSGLNISDRYNDTLEQTAWLDWALYVEGDVAHSLEKICKAKLRLRKKIVSAEARNHKIQDLCKVGVRVNDWLRGKRQIYNSYLKLFHEATSEMIIMSPYFLPGREFRRRISQAAKRGVKIKVILAGNADIWMIKHAERYIYRWLFKNKIEVYEYQKSVLHGKITVFDNKLVSGGSYNVNNLSAFASIELNLEVNHPDFAAHVHKRLEEIIKNDCIRVTERNFNKESNVVSNVLNKSAYEVFRFLFFLSTKQKG